MRSKHAQERGAAVGRRSGPSARPRHRKGDDTELSLFLSLPLPLSLSGPMTRSSLPPSLPPSRDMTPSGLAARKFHQLHGAGRQVGPRQPILPPSAGLRVAQSRPTF